ncbi:MAG: MerR family transcriptional regulator [Bacteroidia bacterium]|nr:MerR family transcriptional regulator [Bacteroidia bacterium]MCZ2276345.1 MerR family transcriptional regulator [Bacteroidia bacterium]
MTQTSVNEKIFWSVTEVAEMLGVNESHIRYWDKEFDIIKPVRNKKGIRFFTKEDIQNFRHIYHLVKEKGYTLEGAKKMMKFKRKDLENTVDVRETLTSLRDFLIEVKESLP